MKIEPGQIQLEGGGENGTGQPLSLSLRVTDPLVITYLSEFEQGRREEKAMEALRVGVIAIRSASPTLDSRVVDEKFQEVRGQIEGYLKEFQEDLAGHMETHFKPGSGTVPHALSSYFGEKGELANLFNQYFGIESGKVLNVIRGQVGPGSEFASSLDPKNKESVVGRIEAIVQGHLQNKTQDLLQQFSLDHEDSALARLRKVFIDQVQELRQANERFFGELRERLGIDQGRAEEAERGTSKGREFEEVLYEPVARLGRDLGDDTESVGANTGSISRCKTGDYVITLGAASGAPGKRIVIEAKKKQGYTLKEGVQELKEAKENRTSVVGILAFAREYAPPEVGDFLIKDQDYFVSVDEKVLESGKMPIFLEAAFKIARIRLVSMSRQEVTQEVDLGQVRQEVVGVLDQISQLSEVVKKAKTIIISGEAIEKLVTGLNEEIQKRLNGLMELLDREKSV